MQNQKTKGKNKLITAALSISVLISLLAVAFSINSLPAAATPRYNEYMGLGLSVSPSQPSFHIGVGQPQTFTAHASNGSAPFTYTWTLTATGNFTVQVNGENVNVSNTQPVVKNGETLTLMYPQAVENDFVTIGASVVDGVGLTGSLMQNFIVADPYTSPGVNMQSIGATASYIIQADGLGWYRAINGTDGSVSWSSTNATTIINNAESTTNANGGGEVHLASGTFPAKVLLYDNVTLSGEGRSTIVRAPSGLTDVNVLTNEDWVNGNSNIEVKNLNVDGNKAGTTFSGNTQYGNGVYFRTVVNGKIFNVHSFNNPVDGIIVSVKDSYNCQIDLCQGHDNNYNGFVIEGNSTNSVTKNTLTNSIGYLNGNNGAGLGNAVHNILCSNNLFYGNNQSGILLFGAAAAGWEVSYSQVTNNEIFDNNQSGIAAPYTQDCLISQNTIYLNNQSGIFLSHASTNQIANNNIKRNGGNGIEMYICTRNVVTGNLLTENSQASAGTYDGIRIYDDGVTASVANKLYDNSCFDLQTPQTQRWGIALGNSADYTLIDGGDLRENLIGGLLTVGVNDIVHNVQNGTSWIS